MKLTRACIRQILAAALAVTYASFSVAASDSLNGSFTTTTTATATTIATVGPGGTNPLPANQATPASIFSIASGLRSPDGRYDTNLPAATFAFSSAQHGSARNYLQQAQVGERDYSNGSFASAGQSTLTQTTVINNASGVAQNLRATVTIDQGLIARANTSLNIYPANTTPYDTSSINWLMKLNGVIIAQTGLSATGKNAFFGGSPYSMNPTGFNLATTRGSDRGDRLGLVAGDASTFFAYERWEAQSFTFDLFNVLGGSNTLEIVSQVTALTSGGYTDTRSGSGPANGRGALTNFAYFGDPLAFASGFGNQGFSLSFGAPNGSSSSGGPVTPTVPAPNSALLLLAGVISVLTARQLARR